MMKDLLEIELKGTQSVVEHLSLVSNDEVNFNHDLMAPEKTLLIKNQLGQLEWFID